MPIDALATLGARASTGMVLTLKPEYSVSSIGRVIMLMQLQYCLQVLCFKLGLTLTMPWSYLYPILVDLAAVILTKSKIFLENWLVSQYHSCWCYCHLCHQTINQHGIGDMINSCLSSMRKDFDYMCHLSGQKKKRENLCLFYFKKHIKG